MDELKVLITVKRDSSAHTSSELMAGGYEVVVLDNLPTGKLENLAQHKNNLKLSFMKGHGKTSELPIREDAELKPISPYGESVLEIVEREDLKPVHKGSKPGDIRHSRADLNKAKDILGYRPKIRLVDGLRRLIEEFGAK